METYRQWVARRNRTIIAMYRKQGMTMERIAHKFGMTRQRVGQILKPHGGAK